MLNKKRADQMSRASLGDRIDQGAGRAPADLVLRGGRILDLVTGAFFQGDVAICGDTIVGTCGTYDAKQGIEVAGRILSTAE